MEKHLPLTAVVFENLVIGMATFFLIQYSSVQAVVLILLAILIIVFSFIQKNFRSIGLGFLASVVLALHTEQPSPTSIMLVYALTGICVVEIFFFVGNQFVSDTKGFITSPYILNGGFAFLGAILGIVYRTLTCPPAFDSGVANYLSNLILPFCMNLPTYTIGRILTDLVTYFVIIAPLFAALAETFRFSNGISLSALVIWCWNFIKSVILGGIFGLFLLFVETQILPAELVNGVYTAYSSWVFWIYSLGNALIMCIVYGWSAALGNQK